MLATLGVARSRPDKSPSALVHELAGDCTFGDAIRGCPKFSWNLK